MHPHPLLGGSMGSRLVYDLAVGLAKRGHRVLRFDFRGVGRSEGVRGDGGEVEDALAMRDVLADETGHEPALVGHSFGGAVALHIGGKAMVAAIATPLNVHHPRLDPLGAAALRPAGKTLIVAGEGDPYVSAEDARRLTQACRGLLVTLPGGHFLEPAQNQGVVQEVAAFLGHKA
jgi:uncharacterized protein